MNAQSKIEAGSLHSDMAQAFAKIEGATKSAAGQVGQQRYKYADLGSVIDAIKPALIEHNLFYLQHCHPAENGVCVETVLYHAGGDQVSLGKLFVPANKHDAQGFGSALTYARRYALVTAFCVPTEDDDGSAASRHAPRAEPVEQPVSDADRDTIQTLAEAVGKPVQDICAAYNVPSLKGLTAKQAQAAINRLQSLKPKEPANA